MGTNQVTVTVRNPAHPDKAWEGLFRVETSVYDTLVPGPVLRQLGFEPCGKRVYEIAEGTRQEMDITTGEMMIMGGIAGSVLIFGPDDAEPALGMAALQSAGIIVDPETQQLKRLPVLPLKSPRRKIGAQRENIVEAYRKLGDPEDRFDIDFWQRQGDEAIFNATMDMILDAQMIRYGHADRPRLDRTVEHFSKL